MDQNEKVRENRLRRWAKRLGLDVCKSRVRVTHLDDYGGYMLVDSWSNYIVEGEKFSLDLDDVEQMLGGREEQLNEQRREGDV